MAASDVMTDEDFDRLWKAHCEEVPGNLRHMIDTYFTYAHLPREVAKVSAPFRSLAIAMAVRLVNRDVDVPETVAGVRKLLEAKDCAVRAVL